MKSNFKHLLLPVDGSERCAAASMLAIDLAKQWQASITVLFVVDSKLAEELARLEKKPPAEIKQLLETTGRRCLNHCAHKAEAEGVATSKVLRQGSPAAEIIDEAEAKDVDLIVMAKSTARGPHRLAVGRTLQRVIEDAECPVIVAKY